MSGRAVPGRENADDLYTIEEHSLVKLLEAEPDLYTASDVKVRFK
jgi:hypothetical protein